MRSVHGEDSGPGQGLAAGRGTSRWWLPVGEIKVLAFANLRLAGRYRASGGSA